MTEGSRTHGLGFEALKPFGLIPAAGVGGVGVVGENNFVLSEKGVKFIVS